MEQPFKVVIINTLREESNNTEEVTGTRAKSTVLNSEMFTGVRRSLTWRLYGSPAITGA